MLRVQHERVVIRRATYSCSLHLGTVHLLIMHNAYQLHKPFPYAKRELLVNKKTVGYSAHQEAYLRTWFPSSIIIEAVQKMSGTDTWRGAGEAGDVSGMMAISSA